MKVVLINDRLNAGGAEKVLVYIANLLFKMNVDVSVLLILEEAALDKELHLNIPVHYLRRKSRFSFSAFKKMKNLVNDADIVHVHSRYNLRYYMIGKFLMGISKPKIFFHEHVPSFGIDKFTKFLFSQIDAYVAVENKMRQWAVDERMVSNEKAFYLANSVITPKEEISFNRGSKKLIMVANFRPQKNHFFAIELMKYLDTDYTLDFYGMIDEVDYYEQVKKAIKDNDLDTRISIIHGVTNIYSKLGDYKLAIHTAKAETGPLVLIEYLFAGIPFVTFNTGDVVEVIKEKLSYFIINDFNVQDWKIRCNAFLENEIEANVGLQREILSQNFSEAAYFRKLESIYKYILGEQKI